MVKRKLSPEEHLKLAAQRIGGEVIPPDSLILTEPEAIDRYSKSDLYQGCIHLALTKTELAGNPTIDGLIAELRGMGWLDEALAPAVIAKTLELMGIDLPDEP